MVGCLPSELWHDLGRSWMLVLLDEISRHQVSFNDLVQSFGISNKVLSERLETLEKHELISREYYMDDGVRHVRISLTEQGGDILEVLTAYRAFITKHHGELPCGDTPCASCTHLK